MGSARQKLMIFSVLTYKFIKFFFRLSTYFGLVLFIVRQQLVHAAQVGTITVQICRCLHKNYLILQSWDFEQCDWFIIILIIESKHCIQRASTQFAIVTLLINTLPLVELRTPVVRDSNYMFQLIWSERTSSIELSFPVWIKIGLRC